MNSLDWKGIIMENFKVKQLNSKESTGSQSVKPKIENKSLKEQKDQSIKEKEKNVTTNWAKSVAIERSTQKKKNDKKYIKDVILTPEERLRRDKDQRMVRGIFHFKEVPQGEIKFFHREHKGTRIEKYHLKDGETYTLPLGVARHLNKNAWYPVHKYSLDENGKPMQTIGHEKHRVGFQNLDFMDTDD